MKLTAQIEPMGAARMTQRGKWTSESAMRYLAYKESIAWQLKRQVDKPTDYAVAVKVTFKMPIPKSWTKERKEIAERGEIQHTSKPDIDNLVKGCFDAANKIVWKDDNLVVKCDAEKVYSAEPGIEIEVTEVFWVWWLFKRKKKNKQMTWCFCINCNHDLCSNGSFVKDEDYVYYKCTNCGTESKWDFDKWMVPVPVDDKGLPLATN